MKTCKILTISSIILLSIIIMLPIMLSEENAKTIYVDASSVEYYTSIQEAIDAANTSDTIYVYSGVYNENLEISKSITLKGQDKNNTIIDGYIIIYANEVKINGFTISRYDAGSPVNNGIEIRSDYNFIIGNIISNNNHGIKLSNSSNNTISNNNIINNTVGIYLKYYSNDNIIYHNNLINNTQNANSTGNNNWYNTTLKQGNYWDDYNGSDKNNDGIGNTPYNISGERCQDLYPFMSPYYGKIVINNFYVDQDAVIYMLWIAMIATILFLIPIAYIWYRKTRPRE